MIFDFSNKNLKIQNNFDPTLYGLAKHWNFQRNKFYQKLREYGILDEFNIPTSEYEDYFIPYQNSNTYYAGKPGFLVTSEGQDLILKTLKEQDIVELKIKKKPLTPQIKPMYKKIEKSGEESILFEEENQMLKYYVIAQRSL